MKITQTKGLKIKLKENDAISFKEAVKIIVDESKKVGFMKLPLNEKQIDVFKSLNDKL